MSEANAERCKMAMWCNVEVLIVILYSVLVVRSEYTRSVVV